MTCETCKWWKDGVCIRFPPFVSDEGCICPTTPKDFYCGEYKPRNVKKREKKIYSEDFLRFWQAYPDHRKKDKWAASQEWEKVKPDLTSVLSALERQKAHDDWKKEDGKYVPYPSRYIKKRRWEDEVVGGRKCYVCQGTTDVKEAVYEHQRRYLCRRCRM